MAPRQDPDRATAALWVGALRPAVVSHWSAAALHGLPLLRSVPEAHVTIASLRRPPAADGLVVHRSDVPREDVVWVEDLPVTSLARTLRDLASLAGLAELVALVDAVRQCHLLPRATAVPSLPGAPRLRQAIALSDPGAQSCFESLGRLGMVLGGFGPVCTQLRLHPGEHAFDLGLPWCRRLFELDGREHHHDDPARVLALGEVTAFERDRRHTNLVARERGWGLTRLVFAQAWPSPLPLWREVRAAVLAGSGARGRQLRRRGAEPTPAVRRRLLAAWALPVPERRAA